MKIEIPQTYGIKYAGSKLKIIPYIVSLINELKDVNTVLDGFSGTTRVSQALAQLGYNITSNDISIWSDVVANCFLKSSYSRLETSIKSRASAVKEEQMNQINKVGDKRGKKKKK